MLSTRPVSSTLCYEKLIKTYLEIFNYARIHIISATPFKRVRWYSFRQPKQKTKEVSNENNIYPSNPRRTIPYLHRA